MRLTNRIKQSGATGYIYFGFSEFRFRFCSLSFCSEVAHKDFGGARFIEYSRTSNQQ